MMRSFWGAVAFAVAATPLAAQEQSLAINEWQVPWASSRPRDPHVDAQGKVWFVGQQGHYIARLDPSSGEFRKWDLEPGAGPHNLIVDNSGIVWYSGNRTGYIGRFDPATGDIRRFQIPDTTIRDPHTMVFDRQGNIWFSAQGANVIGHFNTTTGAVRHVRAERPRSRPYGIMMDQSDRPWIVLFGTNRIATVDPATFTLREYDLPRAEARPRRIAITSDGAVWYGDYAGGMLGRLDPATGRVEEWPLPGGARSRPYAIMQDDQDRVWVFETGAQPNQLVGFDTRSRTFLPSRPIPSGGGTIRHVYFDQRSRAIWFGADVGTIGRAPVPPPVSVP